jgi:hypothetical protein
VADGLDVFFNQVTEQMYTQIQSVFSSIKSQGKRVIISTEPFCGWGGAQECGADDINRFDPVPSGENRFLNAGIYLGNSRDLIWLIDGVIAQSEHSQFLSDQRLFIEFYLKNKNSIALDTKQILFGNFISTVHEVCPDQWKPPCGFEPCCVLTDNIFAMPLILKEYEINACTVTKGYVRPLLWHGNGMGKQIYFYVLHKLSGICPLVASAINDHHMHGTLTSVLEGIRATAPYQERTESWKEAQTQNEIVTQ